MARSSLWVSTDGNSPAVDQNFHCRFNKENNVFKDALGVKGLGFKHHDNHPCNHGSHYGNHHGNYHDNHSNHHGNYNAEQLLFSCQFSKVSSCQVMCLSCLQYGI